MYAYERRSDILSKPFCLETIHINDAANNMEDFHYHDYMEICFIRSGTAKFYIEEKVFGVQKGDVIIINSSERHKVTFDAADPLYETVIHFYPELIWSKEQNFNDFQRLKDYLYISSQFVNKQRRYPAVQQDIRDCVSRIEQEYMAKRPFYEVIVKAQLLLLLTTLVRTGSQLEGEAEKPKRGQIKDILAYIQNNLKNDISLGAISKQYYMNASYFSSYFKEKTGMGFYHYVTRQRIEEAKRLLTMSELSITHIAYECGFNSSGSFYNAFRRVTNMSPRVYRKTQA